MAEKPPQQLQVQIDDKVADGEYANWANIVFSPAEFVVDFGRLMPGKPAVRVMTRVVMSPSHTKRLLEVLRNVVTQYEKQHGEIKGGEDDGHKKVGFH